MKFKKMIPANDSYRPWQVGIINHENICTKMCRLFLLSCLVFLLFSCNQNSSKSAFDFSEEIVDKEQKLMPDIEATEMAVGKYLQNEQYDSAKLASDKMEAKVQEEIEAIRQSAIPAKVKGGQEFKQAAITYFEKIKEIYTAYSLLASKGNDEKAFEEEAAKLVAMVSQKDKAVKDIYEAQLKFSKANNFILGEKK